MGCIFIQNIVASREFSGMPGSANEARRAGLCPTGSSIYSLWSVQDAGIITTSYNGMYS